MADTLKVSVWRGGAEGAWQVFDVPRQDSQTVLDVVSWIQQYADPTLSYRFACRVGMCGSCAMTVDGQPRWTCRTHVARVVRDGALKVGPLRNLPVVKDLVVDMDPFFDKWIAAGGCHEGTATRADDVAAIPPDDPARVAANSAIECINCAVCHAACDTVTGNPDYQGPAALNRAWTLFNDSRHAGDPLAHVSGPGGCHNCHSIGACSARCPNELDPLGSIAGLKRATVRRALGRRDA